MVEPDRPYGAVAPRFKALDTMRAVACTTGITRS
jgi:hypothetical protein